MVGANADQDPLFDQKRAFAASAGDVARAAFPLYADRYPDELVQFLRMACATMEHLGNLPLNAPGRYVDIVSLDNELAVLETIREAATAALTPTLRPMTISRRRFCQGTSAWRGGSCRPNSASCRRPSRRRSGRRGNCRMRRLPSNGGRRTCCRTLSSLSCIVVAAMASMGLVAFGVFTRPIVRC